MSGSMPVGILAGVRSAPGEGIEVFTGEILGENQRMRRLADSLFPGTRLTIESGVCSAHMPLRASEPVPKDEALPERDAA